MIDIKITIDARWFANEVKKEVARLSKLHPNSIPENLAFDAARLVAQKINSGKIKCQKNQ